MEANATMSRKDFNSYRSAASDMIGSLRDAYPELSNDSLSLLCYVAAIQLQQEGGHAATVTPDEFVATITEQAANLAAAIHGADMIPISCFMAPMPELQM